MEKMVYIKTIVGDLETPISIFQKYVGCEKGFLLESKSKDKNRFSFIGTNFKDIIHFEDKEDIVNVLKGYLDNYDIKNADQLPFVGGAVGFVGYDASAENQGINIKKKDVLNLPKAHFFLVTDFIAYDHDYNKILLVSIDTDDILGEKRASKVIDKMQQSLETQVKKQASIYNSSYEKHACNMSKEQFINRVNKAKDHIRLGEISQVVVSMRWEIESNTHPFELYRSLRSLNPSPYLFYFNFGDYQIVGSSPEMMVEIKKDKVYTCPIAGTRPRGKTELEDHKLEVELLEDPKEIKEHMILVDLAKGDMLKVAKEGSMQIKDYMKVHKYSHVMHITSLVEGEKKEDIHSLDVLDTFLPAGTLSGYPRKRAMEIINELEDENRGVYGGAIGYIGYSQEMDMCIAIRMMIIKDEKVYIQAGAGIVADSDPEKEYEECKNKAKALIEALHVRRP